jgi:hypothetical protein
MNGNDPAFGISFKRYICFRGCEHDRRFNINDIFPAHQFGPFPFLHKETSLFTEIHIFFNCSQAKAKKPNVA